MSIVAQQFDRKVLASSVFPELSVLLQRIKETYEPLDVLLYGSRARGDAGDDSDWDIKVIIDDDAPESLLSPMLGWKVQEGSGVYADISCAKLSEFHADLRIANSAAREISRDGIVLELR